MQWHLFTRAGDPRASGWWRPTWGHHNTFGSAFEARDERQDLRDGFTRAKDIRIVRTDYLARHEDILRLVAQLNREEAHHG